MVLPVYLDRSAHYTTVALLSQHERLVTSAIMIVDTATRSTETAERTLDAVASRTVIEQAKGAVWEQAFRPTDSDAWGTNWVMTWRRTSV